MNDEEESKSALRSVIGHKGELMRGGMESATEECLRVTFFVVVFVVVIIIGTRFMGI